MTQKLEEARKLYQTANADQKYVLESLFPELAESEDERIRKTLIELVEDYKESSAYGGFGGLKWDKLIAWLEKQGEQNPAWSEEDERLQQCLITDQEKCLEEVRNDKVGHSEIISDLKEMYRERIEWLKSLKQRIGG